MSQPDNKQPPQHLLSVVVFRDEVRIGISSIKVWRLPEKGGDWSARLTQFGVRFDHVTKPSVTVPLGNVVSMEHAGQ